MLIIDLTEKNPVNEDDAEKDILYCNSIALIQNDEFQ